MADINGKPCVFTDCDSSDAFGYSTDKMVGHCFSCDKSYPHKGMSLKPGTKEKYPLKDSANHKVPFGSDYAPKMIEDTTPNTDTRSRS